MVCIYCGHETEVTNSRKKARYPSVWRRRSCKSCVAQFTTIEMPDYAAALVVTLSKSKHVIPFSRDKLFLSIYKALGHRTDSLLSATALTQTVIGRLLNKRNDVNGAISAHLLAHTVYKTLLRFDRAGAASYKAYHKGLF